MAKNDDPVGDEVRRRDKGDQDPNRDQRIKREQVDEANRKKDGK